MYKHPKKTAYDPCRDPSLRKCGFITNLGARCKKNVQFFSLSLRYVEAHNLKNHYFRTSLSHAPKMDFQSTTNFSRPEQKNWYMENNHSLRQNWGEWRMRRFFWSQRNKQCSVVFLNDSLNKHQKILWRIFSTFLTLITNLE